jgi:hypothetical protein
VSQSRIMNRIPSSPSPAARLRACWLTHAESGFPAATAKTGPAHLMLEDLQLVTKEHELDIGVPRFIGGVGDQPDHAAQQQIHKCEKHVANLPREGGPDPTNALVEQTTASWCALQAKRPG